MSVDSGRIGGSSQPDLHILIIPFPAQGHMLPILDLTHSLASAYDDLTITIAVTRGNLPLLRPLLSRSPSTIRTLVLPFPSDPSIPPGIENNKDAGAEYFVPMIHVLASLHGPILEWTLSVKNPPDAIISDFFLGWTYFLARELGIPRIVFSPSGAFTLCTIHYLWRKMLKNEDFAEPDSIIRFSTIPNSPAFPWTQTSSIYRSYRKGDQVSESVRRGFEGNMDSWGYLFNTFEDLEEPYLEHLRKDMGHDRVWGVGPLGAISNTDEERSGVSTVSADNLINWLNTCSDGSVVYVCFGSQFVLNKEQTKAVMFGLEHSESKFVWSVKSPVDGGDGEIPVEFEKKMTGRGVVIRGWAPQLAILRHPAVGSFVCHCGWNSVLEAVSAGVVLITWPLGADQFISARLLKEIGVGVEAAGREDSQEYLSEIIHDSTSSGKLDDVKTKVAELRRNALKSVAADGTSTQSLRLFVQELRSFREKK